MSKMILEIADDLAQAVRVPAEERLARVRQELALRLYQKRLLSFGKSRQLAAMTKWEFSSLLGEERIPRHYDEDELAEDLKTLEALD